MDAPLIITLRLDEKSMEFFDALRQTHFPKHINFLKAHCTLFHKLPSDEDVINEVLLQNCNRPVIKMNVAEIKHIGNGVVYMIQSAEINSLHLSLQKAFDRWLISQDRQRLRPHVTIQNKVSGYKATMLYNELMADFSPFEITATGFSSWLYLNGPWEHVQDYYFEYK